MARGPVGREDLEDLGADPEGDALGSRRLDLLGLGRHLGEAAAIDDGHRAGAAPEGGPCRVHRGAATADDDDRSAEPRVLGEVDLLEEDRGRDDARELVSGHAKPAALRCAGGEEDGAVSLALEVAQGVVPAHDRVKPEVDPEPDDSVDLGPERLARQAVLGDADGHHPARDRHGLEDGHAVTQANQVVSRGHAGGAAADDGDPLRPFDRRRVRRAAATRAPRRTA